MMNKKPGPKPKPDHLKKVRVSFSCTPDVWTKITKQAEKTHRSISEIVEEVLRLRFN